MFLKTDGLVVRQVNYKDNDQILTVLTKEHGLMTLKARGVRSRWDTVANNCVKSRKHRAATGLPAATMNDKSNHLP